MKNAGPCCRCKTDIYLPDSLYEVALKSPDVWFWCAYGHKQHFTEGESEETKLRRERDRLAQQVAEKDDAIRFQRELREAAERSAAAARGQVTKLKKRAGAGVCPCCNRTFLALQKHMSQKHPTFTAENVVPINSRARA